MTRIPHLPVVPTPRVLVVAWGGGVNSTAMVVEMQRRGVRPDAILFADTGGEKPETMEYKARFEEWLIAAGLPALVTVSAAHKHASLEAQCQTLGVLPSLAYGWKTCSQRWKGEPQDKWLNNWESAKQAWARGEKVTKAIGYDAAETRRAKGYDDRKYTVTYPLIEWGMDRRACEKVLRDSGLGVPTKSACFFCPASTREEVIQLRIDHPKLYARAVSMETNAEAKNKTVAGLGRRWAWKNVEASCFSSGVEMPCGCFDGEEE